MSNKVKYYLVKTIKRNSRNFKFKLLIYNFIQLFINIIIIKFRLKVNQSFGSAASKELTQSEINFDSFACDQDLKENIFRRIYYILSPEHFLSNAKTPPRGFLLHGPPGCGKTQLVYAIAGVSRHLTFISFFIFVNCI